MTTVWWLVEYIHHNLLPFRIVSYVRAMYNACKVVCYFMGDRLADKLITFLVQQGSIKPQQVRCFLKLVLSGALPTNINGHGGPDKYATVKTSAR